MCGRYTLRAAPEVLAEWFDLGEVPPWAPRFNIAPTQPVPVVRLEHGARVLTPMRWGLIPSWADDPKIGSRLINARAETVATKPAFRAAFKQRRCLMLADGFFEWQKAGGKKQPFHIRLKDGAPFAFAALWEQWHAPEDKVIDSCALVTTEASDLIKPIHDRMPVILDREACARWLDPTASKPEEILRPFRSEALIACPIGTWVNDARHDDPRCLEDAG